MVGEAADGDEALRLAERLGPDVLVLDAVMPGLRAPQVIHRLRKTCPDLRVLVLTAYDDNELVFGLLEAGAVGYVLKEEALETIEAAVRATARGESWLSPKVAAKVMSRWLLGFFICLSTLLSGCQVGGTEAPTMPPVEATATLVAPPAASASPEIFIPTVPAGTPTLSPAAPPPPLLYIHQGTLIEQVGDRASHHLADLPDVGTVLAATVIGDKVLVLREQGLQRVLLADGSSELLLRFDMPALYGALTPTADGAQAIYYAAVDDLTAEFSIGSRIGLYQAGSDAVRAALSYDSDVQPWGLTADGRGLYLLPRGQDPGFGRMLVVALESGEIEAELPIEGANFAMLSPNDRYLVTTAQRSVSDDGEVEGVLNLYDLASRPLTPRQVVLPHQPSHAEDLIWSSDSHSLYFMLRPGDLYDELGTSYGLWRLEVETGMLSQVVPGEPRRESRVTISSGGGWMLLRHSGSEMGTLINLETSAFEKVVLPPEAIPTSQTWDWQPPSFLSPSGDWLLLRYLNEDKWACDDIATLVHLPSGASESFALPGEAVVVGWR